MSADTKPSSPKHPFWKILTLAAIVLVAFIVVKWTIGLLWVALKWSLIVGLVAAIAFFVWKKLGGDKRA